MPRLPTVKTLVWEPDDFTSKEYEEIITFMKENPDEGDTILVDKDDCDNAIEMADGLQLDKDLWERVKAYLERFSFDYIGITVDL